MSQAELKSMIVRELEPIDDDGFLQEVLGLMLAYRSKEVSLTAAQLTELEIRSAALDTDGNVGKPWRESLEMIRRNLTK